MAAILNHRENYIRPVEASQKVSLKDNFGDIS